MTDIYILQDVAHKSKDKDKSKSPVVSSKFSHGLGGRSSPTDLHVV